MYRVTELWWRLVEVTAYVGPLEVLAVLQKCNEAGLEVFL